MINNGTRVALVASATMAFLATAPISQAAAHGSDHVSASKQTQISSAASDAVKSRTTPDHAKRQLQRLAHRVAP